MSDRPVALITGGARRVGRAIALELARAGLDCVLTYRSSKDEAEALAGELRGRHAARVHLARVDMAEPDAAADACVEAADAAGRLDVLVHNASVYAPFPLGHQDGLDGAWPLDAEHVMRMYAVNAAAPLLITARLADRLMASSMPGGGAVVCMADMHVLGRPRSRFNAYSMSKAALVEMTRSLARDLAPHARINAVAPGVIAWPEDGYESDSAGQERYMARVPLARTGTPEDAAGLVRWLALEATYVTGEVVRLDGGRWLA
ncbi:MAG: SDR family oxidoreductase [Planctomycetota bacterium]